MLPHEPNSGDRSEIFATWRRRLVSLRLPANAPDDPALEDRFAEIVAAVRTIRRRS